MNDGQPIIVVVDTCAPSARAYLAEIVSTMYPTFEAFTN